MAALLTPATALLIVVGLSILGFFLGRQRAIRAADGNVSTLHSRPRQHGWHVALATFVPAALVLALWSLLSGLAANLYTGSIIPDDLAILQPTEDELADMSEREVEIRVANRRTLFGANIQTLAATLDGYIADGTATPADLAAWQSDIQPLKDRLSDERQMISGATSPEMLTAALQLRDFRANTGWLGPLISISLAVIGFVLSLRMVSHDFRARLSVERWTMGFLIAASTLAILTTIAILAALVVPSMTFFREYGFNNFITGLTWSPDGDVVGVPEGENGAYSSQLGFLPLIWGTLYISLVALLVAVPLGLMAAIYLSEFAGARFRAFAKPALEILAGVPTIVYGIFALVTVGPFLQAVVGSTIMPNTVSVVTAGVVMGMMLVPFVSSLSDDVINAVPQSLRDGSLGLGATKSETVTKVILPAALPGIVGAIVLAASRAIGETMIVVLAAGALSSVEGLEMNPFGAVVTVTTRIVAVLTGEGSGFDSIDVVAIFALAFTLFFITLALNLLAQRIVAKYREQYD